VAGRVTVKAPVGRDFEALMRHLDNLLAEAIALRERVTAAMRRDRVPFWPDRRRRSAPHDPDRRGNG
jgi:hypothetical protein